MPERDVFGLEQMLLLPCRCSFGALLHRMYVYVVRVRSSTCLVHLGRYIACHNARENNDRSMSDTLGTASCATQNRDVSVQQYANRAIHNMYMYIERELL